VASWLAPGQQQLVPADGAATEARLSAEDDPDAVHIFTIASGHMYERLQKIMILSVLRNTRRAPTLPYRRNPTPAARTRRRPCLAASRGRARVRRSCAKAGMPRTRHASDTPDCRLEIERSA
jgi:hypothetical protein